MTVDSEQKYLIDAGERRLSLESSGDSMAYKGDVEVPVVLGKDHRTATGTVTGFRYTLEMSTSPAVRNNADRWECQLELRDADNRVYKLKPAGERCTGETGVDCAD